MSEAEGKDSVCACVYMTGVYKAAHPHCRQHCGVTRSVCHHLVHHYHSLLFLLCSPSSSLPCLLAATLFFPQWERRRASETEVIMCCTMFCQWLPEEDSVGCLSTTFMDALERVGKIKACDPISLIFINNNILIIGRMDCCFIKNVDPLPITKDFGLVRKFYVTVQAPLNDLSISKSEESSYHLHLSNTRPSKIKRREMPLDRQKSMVPGESCLMIWK